MVPGNPSLTLEQLERAIAAQEKLRGILDDDMFEIGIDGRHSYEDNILPVEQAYHLYWDCFAIFGGIDLDFICRSSLERVYTRAKALLAQTAGRGGYALGPSNSVLAYVPCNNYFAMIRAALDLR